MPQLLARGAGHGFIDDDAWAAVERVRLLRRRAERFAPPTTALAMFGLSFALWWGLWWCGRAVVWLVAGS